MKKHNRISKTESAKKQVVNTQVNTEKQNVRREIRELAEILSRAARERASKSQAAVSLGTIEGYHVGIDLGDRKSNYCFLDPKGAIVAEGILATTQAELAALLSSIPKCRIAIEVAGPWHIFF